MIRIDEIRQDTRHPDPRHRHQGRASAEVADRLSLLLQHGIDPQGLAHSMGRLGDGAAASIIGALVDLVSSFERGRAN